jgi:DNA polymerase I-like protein with 3'-5' exonuclease and polymerase domains
MLPWLTTATATGSKIHTTWHQTRSREGSSSVGARTGRLSSSPNFQNIPTALEVVAKLRNAFLRSIPPLPVVRSYIVPPSRDYILIDRDYSQQELRILGHFEGGVLLNAYRENPWLDVHDHARELINGILNAHFDRKPIKNTGFGLIYGMGLGLLAEKSATTVQDAKRVRDAYLAIFPGLKAMYADMKARARNNQPIRTWGSREYYCEPPRLVDGRIRQFDYKLINVLVQGSAADCTKEAINNYCDVKSDDDIFLLNVHDQLMSAVPKRTLKTSMTTLQTAMESVKFDVPMLSEGACSDKHWAALVDYDKKGVYVYGKK